MHTLDLFDTPAPPYQRNSQTSRAAAESVAPTAATQRARVLGYVRARGEDGATMDEVERRLRLTHQAVCPRMWELRKLGTIVDSGRTRATRTGRQAVVWVAR